MSEHATKRASFNLWTEAWITLERREGPTELLGLEQTLLRAQEFTTIYDPSPLVVVGIHRLLTAVLQAALNPQYHADLHNLRAAGAFPASAVRTFAQQYAHRFDLFSSEAPFLQSADLPAIPARDDNVKSVTHLAAEIPSGSQVTHFHHGSDKSQVFCPRCAASGLLTIPPFATSGGAGIKPSINGVPPLYVIPGGTSLFESLAASLVLPDYQPKVATTQPDLAWWVHPTTVPHSQEVLTVGYLHSLTFPARRMRLHPEHVSSQCTRCGQVTEWGVRTMVFDMGESRAKNADPWFDPFAAYRLPAEQSKKGPTPIRPTPGKATWREFGALFLKRSPSPSEYRTQRPSVLDQIAALGTGDETWAYPFRCVGLRTDMKAKVFEWVDACFDVPTSMLQDDAAGLAVDDALRFAAECADALRAAFRRSSDRSQKQERRRTLRTRMVDEYWASLAGPFRSFILALASHPREQRDEDARRWGEAVLRQGRASFQRAVEALPDDAASLRQRVLGECECAARLSRIRNKWFPPSQKEGVNGD